MANRLLYALLLGGLIAIIPTTSYAAQLSGVWAYDSLENRVADLWPDQDAEAVTKAIDTMPDRIGSRALNQLAKSLLLAPAEIKGENSDALTAKRLQKLLSMGALDDAKRLADTLDSETLPAPVVMEQAMLALLANNGKQAACLDLLVYKNERKEDFAALSPAIQDVSTLCAKSAPVGLKLYTTSLQKPITVTVPQLSALSEAEAALVAFSPNVTITMPPGRDIAVLFPSLSPFVQSLIMHSPQTNPALLWRMVPYALRHDLVDIARAKAIYDLAPITGKTIPVADAKTVAKDKNGYDRLPIYYKTLASYGKGDTPPQDALITDILAAGLTSNLYGLLPFASSFDDLDLSKLSPRSGYAAALVMAMNGQSTMGARGAVTPGESAWILSVLLRDQPFDIGAFDQWTSTRWDDLQPIMPGLKARLYIALRDIAPKEINNNALFLNYDKNKSLTDASNYVMHKGSEQSKAESLAKDQDIGGMIIAILLANDNNAPDRLNPAEIVDVVQLLNDTAMTKVARRLLAESLVFKIKDRAANGEQPK